MCVLSRHYADEKSRLNKDKTGGGRRGSAGGGSGGLERVGGVGGWGGAGREMRWRRQTVLYR